MANTTNTGAQIEVSNVMYLAGRGAVIVGHVREGAVRIGQLSASLALGAAAALRLEVGVVEHLSSMDRGGQAVGIAFRNAPDLNELRRRFPAGSLLVLEEPSAADARRPRAF
jgi:translation elongation factor EF-Tu-like GTPase